MVTGKRSRWWRERSKRIDTPSWSAPLEEPPKAFEVRRAKSGERPFGLELDMVKRGAIADAVQLFWGFDASARALEDARSLAQRDAMVHALNECKTDGRRRLLSELHYVLSAELRYGGSRVLRVTGPGGAFFGRQHARQLGDDGELKRVYVKKADQDGIAKRLGVCVRTVFELWSILVRHKVWKRWRPPPDAVGAVRTKDGHQIYVQRSLVGGVPKVITDRFPPDQHRRRRPQPLPPSAGVRLRADELAEGLAYIDGDHFAPLPY